MPFRIPAVCAMLAVAVIVQTITHPAASDTALAGIPDEQRLEVLIRNYDFEVVHRSPVALGGETCTDRARYRDCTGCGTSHCGISASESTIPSASIDEAGRPSL